MNYKDTLNLPSSKFPMKANLPQREPEMLKFWEQINLYKKIREKSEKSTKYILHDGPPYANGDIHIGHAVNKILKDIVIKSKTISGYNAPFIPGWDCHGLPIELMVEKKYGKSKFQDNKNAFRKACREYATKQIKKQKTDFIRLGVTADWDNPYSSMDKDFEASVIKSLSAMIENNHIYYGSKPVHWCIESESALAEGHSFYGLTNVDYDVSEDFRHEHQAPYDFLTCDQTELKIIVRSNPGLVLLKEGVVVEKWAWRDVPSFDDIKDSLIK